MQPKPQRTNHFHNRCKFGVTFWGQRFVKALVSEPRVACNLRYAFGAGDVAQRRGDEGRVTFFKRGFEIRRNVFLGFKVLCGTHGWVFNVLAMMLS